MSHRSIIKKDFFPLLYLSIPLILTGLIQSSLYFFESIFLARLGEDALAAGGLVNWLFATLIVIAFGIFSAVNILVAHRYGAKDHRSISLILRDGLLLSILLTIPTFIVFWNIPIIFIWMGQSQELVNLAKDYLHALAFGLLPKFILIVLFEFLMGLGHARFIMIITLITTPIYIALSYFLIFGKLGLPNLGIAGAGWGMTLVDWFFAIFLCLYLIAESHYRTYLKILFSFRKPYYFWEIIQIGFSIGAMYAIEVGFFLIITFMMGAIGIPELAANQITMQYLAPLVGVVFSIAQAITIRMGHQIGAKQFSALKRTAICGISLSFIFMCFVAIIYWLMPLYLIAIDFNINDPKLAAMINLTIDFLFIAAFFQLLESVRISVFGALRALKDTHYPLFISLICFWGISLPLAYFFGIYLNWSSQSLWSAMIIGGFFNMIFLLYRLYLKIKIFH